VVGIDKGSPRVRFLGSDGVEMVRRMAGDGRGGLRPWCGSMPATYHAGARDWSTGCRSGEVGVEETKEMQRARQGLKGDDKRCVDAQRSSAPAAPLWCGKTEQRTAFRLIFATLL
jgi:hypothetical protein